MDSAPLPGHRERVTVLVWHEKWRRWVADANAYRPLNAMKRAAEEPAPWIFDGWSKLPQPSFWMPNPENPE
jgi:hypothetical protein